MEIDINTILTIVSAVVPSIIAIGTAIGTLLTIIKDFNELKKSVKDATELQQFKKQLEKVLEENYYLKAEFAKFIEYSKTHPFIKSKED